MLETTTSKKKVHSGGCQTLEPLEVVKYHILGDAQNSAEQHDLILKLDRF